MWPNRFGKDSLFGMFTCYFDASGGRDRGIIIVAGWLSTVARWEQFDADWRLLLARYHLPYFHMKEFAHSTGPFEKWKGIEVKRTMFLRRAVDVIATNVDHGFCCLVRHSDFDQVNARYGLSEDFGNPYSLAARSCIAEANKWVRKRKRTDEIQVEYIFDDGDKGKGLLISFMEKEKPGLPLPIFKPSRDRQGMKGLTQLQAADFAAYELLKAHDAVQSGPFHKYRRSMVALARIPAWRKQYTKAGLISLCKLREIPVRSSFAILDP